MTVKRKLYGLAALGILIAAIVAAAAVYGVAAMSSASHSIFNNALLVNKNVSTLVVLFEQSRTFVRGVTAATSKDEIARADAAFNVIDQRLADTSIDVFRSITNEGVREAVTAFIAALDQSRRVATEIFESWKVGDVEKAARLYEEDGRNEAAMRDALSTLTAFLDRLADQELNALEETQRTTTLVAIAVAAAVPFLIVIAFLVARQIATPIAALTFAARDVERRKFEPSSIEAVASQRNELGSLARVFQKMAVDVQRREEELEGLVHERTRDLETKNELLEKQHKRMETELDIARSLQGAMLPQRMPKHPSYSGRAIMRPARELGGDFYDFFVIGEDEIGLVIADVSGKGVPAAFFMAISRTVLQASARERRSAGECLAETNSILCEQNPLDMFVTVFYGILNLRTGELSYANGGHNPPIVVRESGEVTELPVTGGIAMGIMPGLSYEQGSLMLEKGDTLFLYTDGISEAMDTQGREFTVSRLLASLSESHHHSLDIVVSNVTDAVSRFVGDAPQHDDITYLVVRYKGPPEQIELETIKKMEDAGRGWAVEAI
ncbi:SpoIIE family protein phosphatase [Bosea sp. LjRoot90]|uniref:SpoIIE family protein phosphatase n=1 Tax=Bosea sp. LjRoot90 TaxID=3342342 RepID=UPI003ECF7C03